MLNVHALVMAVLLVASFGSLNDASAELSNDGRPAAGQNNLWYAHDDGADTAIVFVHGFASDSRDAWSYEGGEPGQGAYWPALVQSDPKFEGSAIFLGGYHTEIDSHDYGFRDAANELHRSLKISIDPAKEAVLAKPSVLFVTHSAGGIVVRHMLTRHTRDFADKNVGLLLIASPSLGAEDADRLAFIADWVRSKQGHELSFDSPFLQELDKDFKNLVYREDIPKLSGAEWLEHRLVYSKYLGIVRDDVVVGSNSGGRYFGEPITLHDTDHISIVKPRDRHHRTYRELQYFYENDFLSSTELAKSDPPSPNPAPVEQPLGDDAPVRIDEERAASLCDDSVTVELKSVWKQEGGQPKGIVTVSSSALDRGKAVLEIGQSVDLADGCPMTLVDTGRDSKYYAIFE
ncbi:MAG: hypothetical protein ACR2QH_04735 [Geminicoccaceae bacterium]